MDENPAQSDTPATPLQSELGAMERLITDFALLSMSARMETIRELAASDGTVDVVVVGQYKAGKSSFLNALIGRDVLPVDVLPATSVVTRVMAGAADVVIVRFLDGTVRNFGLDRLADFVTESANPDNAKNVEHTDLMVSGVSALEGVRFVDTPGLGSIFLHNTERAKEWLPKVGVALSAIRVDQPIGETDLDLIRELGAHTPDIAILLTKADLATKDQIENVVRFTRQTLKTRLGVECPLIPVSVKKGRASSVEAVMRYLDGSDAGRAAERSTRIARHKLEQLRHQCRVYLDRELAAAHSSEQAIIELRNLVTEERRRFRSSAEELTRLMEHHQRTSMDQCVDHFRAIQKSVADRLQKKLGGEIDGWDGNLAELTARYRAWLESALTAELASLMAEGERIANESVVEARQTCSRTAQSAADRLAGAVEKSLGRRFETASIDVVPKPLKKPGVKIAPAFAIPIDLLWRVFPMKRFRRRTQRHMIAKIPWEVEKNLSRFGAQWGERAVESISGMMNAALASMEEEIAAAEKLAAIPPDRADAIERALKALDTMAGDSGSSRP